MSNQSAPKRKRIVLLIIWWALLVVFISVLVLFTVALFDIGKDCARAGYAGWTAFHRLGSEAICYGVDGEGAYIIEPWSDVRDRLEREGER